MRARFFLRYTMCRFIFDIRIRYDTGGYLRINNFFLIHFVFRETFWLDLYQGFQLGELGILIDT